ncbi:Uncharacterised protein [Mycobacteroides abscessus subsp. abscessus]|uniref:hypothetical protein n=1 Tax=Mycobacteroides abscessus TaxID=36809 RepID=UPI0009272396|nr:hypothetical protein [Mycobacteroides abscessus]SIH21970.1 Uncharacterised protein [Mycobacteroides abscessus subsp. abscessus]
MTSALGIASTAEFEGSIAFFQGLHATLAAATAANTASSMAVEPPDGASSGIKAMAAQQLNASAFAASLGGALEGVTEWLANIALVNPSTQLVDIASAVRV